MSTTFSCDNCDVLFHIFTLCNGSKISGSKEAVEKSNAQSVESTVSEIVLFLCASGSDLGKLPQYATEFGY